MQVLETPRLTLRHIEVRDAEFMLELLNDPSFIRNVADRGVRTLGDACQYILAGPVASYNAHGFGLYLVETKGSATPIGICGLVKREWLKDVDVGFAFLPTHRSKGYAFESARAVKQFAMRALRLTRLVAIVNPENDASIRLLGRLGMRYERTRREHAGATVVRLYTLGRTDTTRDAMTNGLGFPQLIGLPYDASSSFLRGPAAAPPLIREALSSPQGNTWSEEMVDFSDPALLTDAGDLSLPPAAHARTLIEQGIARVLASGNRPLALGGDHSVTYPILRAMNAVHPDLTILHIDAHPDLYEEFKGDRYSHACPFARIMEEGLAKHLVQVGIRTMSGRQRDQVARYDVEVIDMRAWSAGARPHVDGPLYLSLDLDGLDPACAPGVSHREPGGLTTREVLGLIHGIEGPLVGADVVEYNPRQDVMGMTATLAAKLVKEIAAHMILESD